MGSVVFQDIKQDLDNAVKELFDVFGGGRSLLKSSNNVYIKVNGIDAKPHVYTSPKVVGAVARYFFKQGASKVFIMENSTQGNITRLVFEITGMKKMCGEVGAIPVYLDETDEIPMYLPELKNFVNIPDFVHNHLILHRKENLYISMPKLKTHSMTTVTLGIKNQFGLVHQKSRIYDHNFKLHQKLADVYANIQPDFTLIDGIEATNYGHYPAVSQEDKCIIPLNLLIGGNDAMAVDVVGARFLGFKLDEVEHLRLASKYNLGESNFKKIKILNQNLFDEKRLRCSWDLLGNFPEDVDLFYGKTRCCKEGCRRNTEAGLEVLAQDFDGKGGFSILMGKDIDPDEIKHLKGPVHIAGDCAIGDWYLQLVEKFGKKNVTCSPGCNNLATTIDSLCKWTKVHPTKMVDAHPVKILKILAQAKLHGSKANIPNVLKR
ncbi:DUF362 domain-containing protein [bacterium]|nr:DUF362 domain-containing protein [bacterium]